MVNLDYCIYFIIKDPPSHFQKECLDNGFHYQIISEEKEWLNGIKKGHIVILDGYHFTIGLQQSIKEKGGRLVWIDDLHNKSTLADLVINHTPGIKPSDYRALPYTFFCLGPMYAMLRQTFLKAVRAPKKRSGILDTILICFGGADPTNLTATVLDEVLAFDIFKKIIVVTGAAYLHQSAIREIYRLNDHIEDHHSIDEKKMVVLLREAGVVIVPASSMLYEALAIGSVVVSGYYVENQKKMYNHFNSEKMIVDAEDFSKGKVTSALKSINKKVWKEKKIIDGKSGDRIRKVFHQLAIRKDLVFRKAVKVDLSVTLKWAQDKQIRRFALSQNKISKEEHRNWYLKKISNYGSHYLMVLYKRKRIGTVRFDKDENNAVISYLLDPQFHGRGLGAPVLAGAIEDLMNNTSICTHCKTLQGVVLKDNFASVRVFNQLGFDCLEKDDKYIFTKRLENIEDEIN